METNIRLEKPSVNQTSLVPKFSCLQNLNSSEDHGRPLEALQRSLDKLGVESVDLYLMHWPMSIENDRVCSPDESPFTETWKMMESLVETGLCITVIRLPF